MQVCDPPPPPNNYNNNNTNTHTDLITYLLLMYMWIVVGKILLSMIHLWTDRGGGYSYQVQQQVSLLM